MTERQQGAFYAGLGLPSGSFTKQDQVGAVDGEKKSMEENLTQPDMVPCSTFPFLSHDAIQAKAQKTVKSSF